MVLSSIVNIAYLAGAIAFVIGLRRLSSPDTARTGNILAAIGMGIAIVATLIKPIGEVPNNYIWIFGGIALGGIIGWIAAHKIKMTAMPQMVSVFNGLGGACAVILAMLEYSDFAQGAVAMSSGSLIIVMLAVIIGGISFTGSMLAYAKLEGLVWDNTLTLPKHNIINILLLIVLVVLAVVLIASGQKAGLVFGLGVMGLALLYGVSFVAPIGGADMPVVISLLNSFTGLSAAAAGLIYNNQIMLVGGIFVGASGTILTVLMCQAMNRSLLNVLIGGFGGSSSSSQVTGAEGQVVKEVTPPDAAIMLYYSKLVVVVPGYGLAVAQAQKVCKELQDLLEGNGVEVKYGIHPVAGRMPGHMNVLLAEADVPYPNLLDLDDTNNALKDTDVAVIVGANDVVNPSALDDPGSPIYGMPILRVWDAKNVIILKRSMRPGYSGIENPLFFHAKTKMLFGDAKHSIQELVKAVKGM